MTIAGRKRFYQSVSVRPEGDGFVVLLDTRPLKTPAGRLLVLPAPLAESVAREWEAQAERIVPARMPLTRMANTAIDQTAARPREVVERLAAYGETDLLCHWAEHPDELVARQQAAWQPVLDWAAALGVGLAPVAGIRPIPQLPEGLSALHRHLVALDPLSLTAADLAAAVTGSVILALALAYGRLDAAEAWRLSRIDEDYQIEKWGEDAEARARAEERRRALEAAAMVFAVLRPQPEQGQLP